MCFFSYNSVLKKILLIIPYSGKLSREKTFVNFVDLEPFVKVFSTNFEGHVSQLHKTCYTTGQLVSKYYVKTT